MKNQIKNKGFSLVELIAVIGILGIAYIIVFQIFTTQTKIYNLQTIEDEVQNSGRLCLNTISEDIRRNNPELVRDVLNITYAKEFLGLPEDSSKIKLIILSNEQYKNFNNFKKLSEQEKLKRVEEIPNGTKNYMYIYEFNSINCKLILNNDKNESKLISDNIDDVSIENNDENSDDSNIYTIRITIKIDDYSKIFSTDITKRYNFIEG